VLGGVASVDAALPSTVTFKIREKETIFYDCPNGKARVYWDVGGGRDRASCRA
jgi:hypothetical protein